ncbi:unnamed protein product [marine sediment metagenome]|uniref:Uncharacterized protein n=1 Tax=marine sediment metagenome TaxID=412755 RepID=X1D445_9ZZZZ
MKKIIVKITKEEAESFKKFGYTKTILLDLLEDLGLRRKYLFEAMRDKYKLSPEKLFKVDAEKKTITYL